MSDSLHVLVVGAGVYVCGRGTEGFGTILPALWQLRREGRVGRITVVATGKESCEQVGAKAVDFAQKTGLDAAVETVVADLRTDPGKLDTVINACRGRRAGIIATPDHVHYGHARRMLEHDIPTLVVKPLTPGLREGRALCDLARRRGVYTAVEFHKRFDEANLILREKYRNGELGDICYIHVEYSQRRRIREAFRAWIGESNIFQYLGVHYVDLIHFISGHAPLRASALGQKLSKLARADGAFDSIEAMVEWKDLVSGNRFVSTILTNWIDPDASLAMSDQLINIVGTAGRVKSDQMRRGVCLQREGRPAEEINPYFCQIYPGADGDGHVHGYGPRSVAMFAANAQRWHDDPSVHLSRRDSLPDFGESLVSVAVLEAVQASLQENGAWKDVEASAWK